jgi:hypothetical protein
MMKRIAIVVTATLLLSCGGAPPIPKRGVVESDVGDWKFRRYQPVLDVEVWVADNPAEAFTASYVDVEGEKRGVLRDQDVANVFVTRYQSSEGVLRETVKFVRKLAKDSGYQVDEDSIDGVRIFKVVGNGESWALWAARKHVVKVGGKGRTTIATSLVEQYGDRYQSLLRGGMLEGPLPAGRDTPKKKDDDKGDDDSDGGDAKPDWQGYDPNKPAPTPKPEKSQ